MKTTIELPDELLAQVRAVARREGVTLRQLIEEGLQRALEIRECGDKAPLDFPVYGGSGLNPEFEAASWERIREEIYATRRDSFVPGRSAVHDRG